MNPAASWRSLKKLLVSELGDMRSALSTADPGRSKPKCMAMCLAFGRSTDRRTMRSRSRLRRGSTFVSEGDYHPMYTRSGAS